mgnify:CR=1
TVTLDLSPESKPWTKHARDPHKQSFFIPTLGAQRRVSNLHFPHLLTHAPLTECTLGLSSNPDQSVPCVEETLEVPILAEGAGLNQTLSTDSTEVL